MTCILCTYIIGNDRLCVDFLKPDRKGKLLHLYKLGLQLKIIFVVICRLFPQGISNNFVYKMSENICCVENKSINQQVAVALL